MANCEIPLENRTRPMWTGKAVAMMHIYRITQEEICAQLGYARPYIAQLLSGAKETRNGEELIMGAISKIVDRKINNGEIIEA